MPLREALLEGDFLSRGHSPDDTSLRSADEFEDGLLFLAVREPCFNLGTAVADIEALIIDRIVYVLYVADHVRGKSPSP